MISPRASQACNRIIAALSFVFICLICSSWADGDEPLQVDLLLRGGTVYDGTGAEGGVADLAVRKDRIVAIGSELNVNADRVLECKGLIVAPGWIDLHTHSDDPILDPETRANVGYLIQGCTTVVTGNCGSGPIRVDPYLKKIAERGAGTNVAHLLPHGNLRSEVLQKEARDPTPSELQAMCRLAEEAMNEGAWGMSTGLIYVPGTFSKTEELIEIAKVIGSHGGIYASHIRNESGQLLEAIDEAIKIGSEGKLPVHVSHFKASGKNAWGTLRLAADRIEQARRNGQVVTADQYPYTASSTSLEATLLPSWSREGGRPAIKKRLEDPEQWTKIHSAVKKQLDSRQRIQIAVYDPNRKWIGKSLDEIASMEQREAVDIVLEMEAKGGAKVVNFGMQEDEVRMAMRLPWVATASDGGAKIPGADQPHPRSFGTFARKIGRYAIQDKELPLAQAIYSCSGLPSEILGLKDRGCLKPEWFADIVVFDPQRIMDQATYEHPFRFATGVQYVFVNGVPAVEEGVPTGALAGKALKKTQP